LTTLYNYKKDIFELEDICTSIIEEELDIFFKSCIKSSHAYSIMICDNLNNHSKENFESVVISKDEILSIVEKIYMKIEKNLTEYVENINIEDIYEEVLNASYHKFLDDSISQINLTTKIITTCESLINKICSKAFDYMNPSYFVNQFAKKINMGENLLGKNFKKSIINQEKIQKQLEGILINIKLDLRNNLLENIFNIFNDISLNSSKSA
jgi:hypothetical protein